MIVTRAASGTEIERHEAFRAALLAFAYPGRPQRPPFSATDPESLARITLAAIFEPALLEAELANAVVFARIGSLTAPDVLAFPRGSEESPEDGATVVFVPHANASTTPVRLSGPGIETTLTCALPLDAQTLAARAEACKIEPLGIDLLVIERAGITGLPRGTFLQVLD